MLTEHLGASAIQIDFFASWSTSAAGPLDTAKSRCGTSVLDCALSYPNKACKHSGSYIISHGIQLLLLPKRTNLNAKVGHISQKFMSQSHVRNYDYHAREPEDCSGRSSGSLLFLECHMSFETKKRHT